MSLKKLSKNFSTSNSSVMESLLSKYETGIKSFTQGQKIKGTVLEITPKRVVVDIGGKSEGMVAEKAFKEAENYIKTLKVGDEIEASVIIPETRDGFTILSFRAAKYNILWKKLLDAEESGEPIRVEGKQVSPSGITVDVEGLTGFIPKSQLGREISQNIQSLEGKRFDAVVIDADRENNKVILSEKEISEAEELALVRKAIEEIKEGSIFDGTVTNIYDFGCFVKIEAEVGKGKNKEDVPLEGLVHISEISWDKVRQIDDAISPGDKVKVKIIGKSKGRLAMSIKHAQSDPWDDVEKRYKKEKRVKGTVLRMSDFGVFILLEPGIEGLVHMTKIPPGKRFEKGEEVNVYIEEVDKENRKVSLGLVLTAKPLGYK